jgi:hypothetical protein
MSTSFITQGWGAGLGIPITVALPPFPNVASLPGVPQLARSLLIEALAPPALGFAANPDVLWRATQSAPVWGVFDENNNLAVNADSVQGFDWRKENRIPNFPVQAGQFGTYNRVGLPSEESVILSKGSANGEGLAARTRFLQEIDAIVAQSNISLYTIRTPEKSYVNVSVTRAEMSRRGVGNANYIDVELYFIEIVQVAAQYSTTTAPTPNAREPSALPVTNQGLNNPQTPTTAVQKSALAAITPPVPTG